ncbi:hypothetical protein AMC90_CH02866 [Rhizobium phaseoli]|uniref:hypothetical protein n=1 Tax=Rhizobium phaseoli TaxID=396 RepID=UPI0007EB5253|nr:hypothetical protein [Rhizobium phaseoli]ANL28665.1 hypothetical protein AMC90_CH02866 [Rhizobium phaseoli]ANM04993.1 hypothetical protein AMC78_CH02916 [Rhizobium phaseoli]
MHVPPWAIMAGLGALERREVSDLLANFEATTLLNISRDKIADTVNRLKNGSRDKEVASFARRLRALSDKTAASGASTSALRLRLWMLVMQSLDLDPKFPLSTRTSAAVGASLANAAATVIAQPLPEEGDAAGIPLVGSAVRRMRTMATGGNVADFDFLVNEKAKLVADSVAKATQTGELNADDKAEIERRVRTYIETLPPESQDAAARDAMKRGDNAALLMAVSGTSALAVGVGVNLAGFSAYVLAAQASAFIPFVSGPAAVSTLFMLANPLFSVPAVVGIGYLASRHVNGQSASRLAANVIVHLGLRGMSVGADGLASVLDQFRMAPSDDLADLPIADRHAFRTKMVSVSKAIGGRLPDAPRGFPGQQSADGFAKYFQGVVSASRGDVLELSVVGAATTADILFNAASIDPMVVSAADFSRIEDISDIFKFGQFADRIASMTGAAAVGAGNNLRGYVSEQIVAARLAEHGYVVEFPDTSNNPAFDLLVDGNPFQVKCLLGLDGLREHFSKYPDMRVYANGELADAALASGEAWASNVFYIDGFDHEIACLITRTSLEAGEALGDLHVPYFAMAASTGRNLYRWWRGRMQLSDLPLSVLIDNAVKGGLATVGGISGKTIGLLAFGPAGALVLGSVGGLGALFGAGWTREQATRLLSSEWLAELGEATERFRVALEAAIRSKIELLQEKRTKLPEDENPVRKWVDSRFSDEIVSLAEAGYDLEHGFQNLRQPTKARACLEVMRQAAVHPVAVEAELTGLLKVLASEPSKTEAAGKKASQVWNRLAYNLPIKSKS